MNKTGRIAGRDPHPAEPRTNQVAKSAESVYDDTHIECIQDRGQGMLVKLMPKGVRRESGYWRLLPVWGGNAASSPATFSCH